MANFNYDYIICGGGSTGCTLAGRLTEDPTIRVLLLEAGPNDRNLWIRFPATYYKVCQGPLLTRHIYEPSVEQSRPRTPSMIQARVLGGGSSVNAMLYLRGIASDYNDWADQGATGWGYADVLPYFLRAEHNNRFANADHGTGGPLGVSDPGMTHPLTRRWIQACQQRGLPYNPDFNSGDQAGVGPYQITVRDGIRSSASAAYLPTIVRRRRNLTILTGATVTRLRFMGKVVTGVDYVHRGQKQHAGAAEVVLSQGSFATPKLLMQSGVGPADHLRHHGIDMVADLPGVGQNYQDHIEMSMVWRLNGPHSYDKYKKKHWMAMAGLEYLLFGRGPVTTNMIEAGAFWRSSVANRHPDLQFFFVAGAGIEEGVDDVPGGNGCTISVTQTRPRSRGHVSLTDADPSAPLRIVPNYLTHPDDLRCLADGAKLMHEVMGEPAISPLVAGGHVPSYSPHTIAEWEDFVRAEAHPGLHPCGTCRIGQDALSVVDPALRVHQLEGLRIADASVMPNVISGNLNAVCIMIGERAADILRGQKLPAVIAGTVDSAQAFVKQ
jgi:choline dehydrogenase